MCYTVHTLDKSLVNYFFTLQSKVPLITPSPLVKVTKWLDETVGAGNWSFEWISFPKNPCNEINLSDPKVKNIAEPGGNFYFDKEEDKLMFVFRWLTEKND